MRLATLCAAFAATHACEGTVERTTVERTSTVESTTVKRTTIERTNTTVGWTVVP